MTQILLYVYSSMNACRETAYAHAHAASAVFKFFTDVEYERVVTYCFEILIASKSPVIKDFL